MPEIVTIGSAAELPPGERAVIEIGSHAIVVFNVDNRYYAIEDLCTHDDGPLADGELDGLIIECPRHGAQFDISSGAVRRLPAVKPVPRYEIRVVDGQLQIVL